MADNDVGGLRGSTDAGVTGKHEAPNQAADFLVGPTTSDQFNTLAPGPIPVACFRVDDIRFAFGNSFVESNATDPTKDIRAELALLVQLIKDHPECPLSIFGHADPIGDDESNKRLSGRRASVIYALIIFNSDPDAAVKIWNTVSQQEGWGSKQQANMQALTGMSGTPISGLIKPYMQKLVPPELKTGKKDFLAQGADAGGKGDYQGCSEFNPALVFSTKKNTEFEKQSDKTARNDANGPNRRVMILLFRKGSKVEPSRWPCPRASEGASGCKVRFWSDGESRRTRRLPDVDRTFNDTKDTFACRFYHRLASSSPCEEASTVVKIRLFDAQGRPLPGAPCAITEPGKATRLDRATGTPPSPKGTTPGSAPGSVAGGDKEDAVVKFSVQKLPATVNLKWSRAKANDASGPTLRTEIENSYKFEFEMDVTVDIADADDQAASGPRLKNLGYVASTSESANIREFQKDAKPRSPDVIEDGTLNPPTVTALKNQHDNTEPVLRAGSNVAVKR